MNFNSVAQIVFDNISSGKLRQFRLNLHPHYPAPGLHPVSQYEGYHAAARPQLDYMVFFPDACKAGKQDCIQGEAISFWFLTNSQPSVEKGVAGMRPFLFQMISSSA
jgi:hypothetical protein